MSFAVALEPLLRFKSVNRGVAEARLHGVCVLGRYHACPNQQV